MSDLRNALDELRAAALRQRERLSKRVLLGSQLGVAIGADPDGGSSLALRVEGDNESHLGELQDSEGLSFGWSEQDYGPGRWFEMSANDQEDAEIFAHICSDLEPQLLADDATQAIKGIGLRIRMWQRFLAVGKAGLGPRQQMGLWGELQVLQVLANGIGWNRALLGWVGPGGASQDFREGAWAAEVKTTSFSADSLAISSLDQLDTAIHSQIYLVHIGAAELSPTEGQPLSDAVEKVRAKVQDQAELRAELENRLLASGYHSMHERRYSRRGFLMRVRIVYQVRDNFPRLERSSLPSAIKGASYNLFTKDIASFAVSAEELPNELHSLVVEAAESE